MANQEHNIETELVSLTKEALLSLISLENELLQSQSFRMVRSYDFVEFDYDILGSQLDCPYDALVSFWGYSAPETLAKALLPFVAVPSTSTNILDVGCGTGLSGLPYLQKKYRVDGIDLSETMLEHAHEKGYHFLRKHNVVDPIPNDRSCRYDVAVSVGVFCDYVASREFRNIFPVLQDKASIGIAGEMREIDRTVLANFLTEEGFFIKHHSLGRAYHPRHSSRIYTYIVAIRGL
jgi:SAM-dependent methyltransferase